MDSYYWIIFIFCITITAWLMGVPSVAGMAPDKYCDSFSTTDLTATAACLEGTSIWDRFISFVFSLNGILSLGTAVATLAVLGGLNMLVIVPLAFAFVLLEFFVFPSSLLLNSGLPMPLPQILMLFFQLMTILSIVMFIRRG